MPTVPSKATKSVPPKNQGRSASSAIDVRHESICDEEHLITECEAAELLVIAVKTLRNWRFLGRGPPHLKVGRLVRYRLSDLKAWLKTCERSSTSDQGGDHA
jgi:hypothetical protein